MFQDVWMVGGLSPMTCLFPYCGQGVNVLAGPPVLMLPWLGPHLGFSCLQARAMLPNDEITMILTLTECQVAA